jgi:protein-arginine kinase activator protein McsA
MAAAVKIEDYETAAQIKKQIEKVNNDSWSTHPFFSGL